MLSLKKEINQISAFSYSFISLKFNSEILKVVKKIIGVYKRGIHKFSL